MPTARTEVAAAAAGGKVFVAGGFTADGRASDALEVYDPKADAWQRLGALPKPVHHAGLVSVGETLYLIGGYTEAGPTDEVWTLAPGATGWAAGPRLPVPAGALAAGVSEGEIYAAGGATGLGGDAKLSEAAAKLRPGALAWERLPPLPEARDHLTGAGLPGRFMVLAGRKLSLETNSRRADVFDVDRKIWSQARTLRHARGGIASAVTAGGRVVVAGGEEPGGTIAFVETFDPATGDWTDLPPLPAPRHGLGAAFIDGTLIVVAGGPTPGLSVSGTTQLLRLQ
jgi:hypothetical protein